MDSVLRREGSGRQVLVADQRQLEREIEVRFVISGAFFSCIAILHCGVKEGGSPTTMPTNLLSVFGSPHSITWSSARIGVHKKVGVGCKYKYSYLVYSCEFDNVGILW